MVRVVLFLVLVGLIALGFAWLIERPGEVTITWLGWRIETSLTMMAASVVLVTAGLILLWSLLRLLVRSPRMIARARASRRREQGFRAISRGLIAVGAGDMAAARKFAAEASRFAPAEPLALLLKAQNAQLSADRAAAERVFRDMAGRADTRLIGLRGLYVEAQRRDDAVAARLYAEEAAKSSAALSWAGRAVLESRSALSDWAGALEALESNRRGGLIDKASYRRLRAVLLVAHAQSLGAGERVKATALASEAAKLEPTFIPAAVTAGKLLAEAGETRKAAKILQAAWRANPHPDIAEIYAYLKPGETTRARLSRVQALARLAPGHVESALAVARAALAARDFAKVRDTLLPLLAAPTKRVAELMAELEEAEHGDEGRAREWMARALRAALDPAWIADGFVSSRWRPVSPVSGRLDAFEWTTPSIPAMPGAVLDNAARPIAIERSPDQASAAPAPDVQAETPAEPEAAASHGTALPTPGAASDRAPASSSPPHAPERPEAIIPLVHAPDDPGPEPDPPGPAVDGRRGMRLFLR